MKILKNRVYVILSDILLLGVFLIVFAVSFIPENTMPIYGGENISPIYKGNKDNPNISLMFNVYENTEVVNGIVDLLDSYGVKATFFVGGCWADDNADTLIKIVGSGHEIANHGYFHKDHKNLDYNKNKEEIELTSLIVNALAGVDIKLFAPPSGSFNDNTLLVCSDLDLKVIMWSKDTIDWRDNDVSLIIKRATTNIENGDLVLMHPKEHTLKALPKIISAYLDKGFNLTTVSENIS